MAEACDEVAASHPAVAEKLRAVIRFQDDLASKDRDPVLAQDSEVVVGEHRVMGNVNQTERTSAPGDAHPACSSVSGSRSLAKAPRRCGR